MDWLGALDQSSGGIHSVAMMVVQRFVQPQQHIGIDENAHSPRGGSYSPSRLSSTT
jgi:hypothetical protein